MSAIALAVTGIAARAMAAGSSGTGGDSFTVTEVAPPSTPAPTPAAPTLPPVQIEPLPASSLPSSTARADAPVQSMSQTLVVPIAGGSMWVSPGATTVVLTHTHDRHFSGTFGPIVVTDARGSLAGWTLTAALTSRVDGKATIHPGPAVALTGNPGEAAAARASDLTSAGSVLMSAAPEGGGGRFEVSGTVDLSGGPSETDQISVGLIFSVA